MQLRAARTKELILFKTFIHLTILVSGGNTSQ